MLEKVKTYLGIGKREFLLEGPAGTGKTFLTKKVAEELGAAYVFVQAYPGMRFDEFKYELLPSEEKPSGVELVKGVLIRAVELSWQGPVVLVIDEFDKTLPSADAFMLDFLQYGRVSFKEELLEADKSNLIVFLTSNGFREFSEPLLRRVVRIKFDHPTAQRLTQMLKENGVPEDAVPMLIQLHKLTVQAGLRKPATVQELKEFYLAVQAGIPIKDALLETVIKYEEDETVLADLIEALTGQRPKQNQVEEAEEVMSQPAAPVEEQQTEQENAEVQTNATAFYEAIDKELNEGFEEKIDVRALLGRTTSKKFPILLTTTPDLMPRLLDTFNDFEATDDPSVKLGYGKVMLVKAEENDAVFVGLEDQRDFAKFKLPALEVYAKLELPADKFRKFIQEVKHTVIAKDTTKEIITHRDSSGQETLAIRAIVRGDKATVEVIHKNPRHYSIPQFRVEQLQKMVEEVTKNE